MAKRMLDCCASDFAQFTKADLLESIQKSEGRVIACETIGSVQPLLGNVTNAEFAASMGADILLLNLFDVQQPVIHGLPPVEPGETIRLLKKLTGRPVGINLEPVADDAEIETDPMWAMSAGRRATVENALRAKKLGIDFVLLTGNPGVGVTNTAIEQTLRRFKEAVGDSIVLAAGKMHAHTPGGLMQNGTFHISNILLYLFAAASGCYTLHACGPTLTKKSRPKAARKPRWGLSVLYEPKITQRSLRWSPRRHPRSQQPRLQQHEPR